MAVIGKNPIAEGNFHGFLLVTVKVLNSYDIMMVTVQACGKLRQQKVQVRI